MRTGRALLLFAVLAGCTPHGPDSQTAHRNAFARDSVVESASSLPSSVTDLATLLADSASGRRAVPVCIPTTPLVVPESIGPLRPGQTLARLMAVCPQVLRGVDGSTVNGPDVEAARAVALRLGKILVMATLTDTTSEARVSRLVTGDSAARLPSGIHPGSLLQAAAAAYGTPRLAEAECMPWASFAPVPNVGFLLALPRSGRRDCGTLFEDSLGRSLGAPVGTRVLWIVVVQPQRGGA